MPLNHRKLALLCSTIHRLLYVRHNKRAARACLPQLGSFLKELPEDDGSIIGAEAQALFHELSGDLPMAISSRRREIALMKKLYDDVATHKYDANTRRYVLAGRGQRVFNARKAIIKRLLSEVK